MPSLIIIQGPESQIGKQYILKNRTLAGGRHPSQEIQLLDPEVSRRHFLIRMVDGAHVIAEAHAANGLHVNGLKVQQCTLQEGDQIGVGATVLLYSKNDEASWPDEVQRQRRAERQLREGSTVLQDPPML